MTLRLAGTENDSIVDGPGIRFTIFVQGCPHHCPGCHNPQTHDFSGGTLTDTGELLKKIEENPLLDGVTFSGGEPFCQAPALAELGGQAIIWAGSPFCNKAEAIELAHQLDEMAEMAAPYGIKIGYHNHSQEFFVDEGKPRLQAAQSTDDVGQSMWALNLMLANGQGTYAELTMKLNSYRL